MEIQAALLAEMDGTKKKLKMVVMVKPCSVKSMWTSVIKESLQSFSASLTDTL